ncbi:phosphoribosyl 1,2-cyclic phosphodiesterase [Alkalibaculum bacchi]|uniref:Phosphoribosyl 1,2-cyclic phosphodiesterase n=1 Tax=Alkalibaculum bacchi TaxID=645887 RepID=A0A366I4Q6_9FIRM|nr:MBL fold metallo-hydrolase [Alkalibaculum bacchi]RBP62060.1 phosphoribosyl 1,2-cyclic phosphodiesterase [Alkalibaculum bacchi]
MKFCSLYSGSSGNCSYLEDGDTKILIDAGVSGKRIEENLKKIQVNPQELTGLFLSHDHIDHTKGAGVLSRRYNIPIYANGGTWNAASTCLGKIRSENRVVFASDKELILNGLSILPFSISHDAGEPVGFSITNGKNKISIVTDTGEINGSIMKRIENSDLAVIESNHDVDMLKAGPYPYPLKRRILGDKGHLSNEVAASAILELVEKGLRRVLLAHLSDENNFPELAFETTSSLLTKNKIKIQKDVTLEVASRFTPSTVFSF